MSAEPGIRVPVPVLLGALGLVSFTFAAIALGRTMDVGTFETPPVRPAAERGLVFRDGPGAGMTVRGEAGARVATLVVEGDSFAIAAVRALAMQRSDDALASGYGLRLRRDAVGRLELSDPRTGRRLNLAGFGKDNIRAFGTYLDDDGRPDQPD